MSTGSTGPPFSKFGPDNASIADIDGLPGYGGFAACMANNGAKLPNGSAYGSCDELVGSYSNQNSTNSAGSNLSGVCGDPSYWQSTYCACVNNFQPCPMYQDPVCGNSSTAYQPAAWFTTQGSGTGEVVIPSNEAALCKNTPICVNLVQVGGASNVLPGTIQQCGAFTPITNTYSANIFLVVLVFILVVVLVWLLKQPVEDTQSKTATGSGQKKLSSPINQFVQ